MDKLEAQVKKLEGMEKSKGKSKGKPSEDDNDDDADAKEADEEADEEAKVIAKHSIDSEVAAEGAAAAAAATKYAAASKKVAAEDDAEKYAKEEVGNRHEGVIVDDILRKLSNKATAQKKKSTEDTANEKRSLTFKKKFAVNCCVQQAKCRKEVLNHSCNYDCRTKLSTHSLAGPSQPLRDHDATFFLPLISLV